MALLRVTVTLAGAAPVTVDAHTRHQIQWERHARAHKIPAAPGPGFGATEYAAFLAWSALRETTDAPESFDAFLTVLEELDSVDEPPADPTRAAAG